jgi:hypothetical protein
MLPEKPSQAQRLYELLKNGRPYRTDEIVAKVYGPGSSLARGGARIWDIKRKYHVAIDWKKMSTVQRCIGISFEQQDSSLRCRSLWRF